MVERGGNVTNTHFDHSQNPKVNIDCFKCITIVVVYVKTVLCFQLSAVWCLIPGEHGVSAFIDD